MYTSPVQTPVVECFDGASYQSGHSLGRFVGICIWFVDEGRAVRVDAGEDLAFAFHLDDQVNGKLAIDHRRFSVYEIGEHQLLVC